MCHNLYNAGVKQEAKKYWQIHRVVKNDPSFFPKGPKFLFLLLLTTSGYSPKYWAQLVEILNWHLNWPTRAENFYRHFSKYTRTTIIFWNSTFITPRTFPDPVSMFISFPPSLQSLLSPLYKVRRAHVTPSTFLYLKSNRLHEIIAIHYETIKSTIPQRGKTTNEKQKN